MNIIAIILLVTIFICFLLFFKLKNITPQQLEVTNDSLDKTLILVWLLNIKAEYAIYQKDTLIIKGINGDIVATFNTNNGFITEVINSKSPPPKEVYSNLAYIEHMLLGR